MNHVRRIWSLLVALAGALAIIALAPLHFWALLMASPIGDLIILVLQAAALVFR
jgi:hypothetical protein